MVFLPINIHENHWILLAANFWVHPKDASLFEMASLMGKPKGVATGDSEMEHYQAEGPTKAGITQTPPNDENV